jgi:hypothetical protein
MLAMLLVLPEKFRRKSHKLTLVEIGLREHPEHKDCHKPPVQRVAGGIANAERFAELYYSIQHYRERDCPDKRFGGR